MRVAIVLFGLLASVSAQADHDEDVSSASVMCEGAVAQGYISAIRDGWEKPESGLDVLNLYSESFQSSVDHLGIIPKNSEDLPLIKSYAITAFLTAYSSSGHYTRTPRLSEIVNENAAIECEYKIAPLIQ